MRLFVAIRAPKGLLNAIEEASSPLDGALGVRLLPKENLHITLIFIGEADKNKAKKVEQALSKVKFSPFTVSLSGAGAYPNTRFPRAIWIGGESKGAHELAAKVENALKGICQKKGKFSVHLTVARSPKSAGDIEGFLKNTGEVGEFEVFSFLLMKSTLLPTGASYQVLREFAAKQG